MAAARVRSVSPALRAPPLPPRTRATAIHGKQHLGSRGKDEFPQPRLLRLLCLLPVVSLGFDAHSLLRQPSRHSPWMVGARVRESREGRPGRSPGRNDMERYRVATVRGSPRSMQKRLYSCAKRKAQSAHAISGCRLASGRRSGVDGQMPARNAPRAIGLLEHGDGQVHHA